MKPELRPFLAIDRDGPAGATTVVLLHGGGQTRRSWTRVARSLHDAGYRTIRYDARGHGDSAWLADGDYSVAAQAADLAAVLDGVAPERAVLVGASIGGIVALHLAARTSHAFSAVVLVDVTLRAAPAGAEELLGFLTRSLVGFDCEEEAADVVAEAFSSRPERPEPAGVACSLRPRADGRLRWHWDPLIVGEPGRPRLPDMTATERLVRTRPVAVPVLLMRGGASTLVDQEGVDHLRGLVPQLAEVVIPDVGHMLVAEANDQFGVALLQYLAALATTHGEADSA